MSDWPVNLNRRITIQSATETQDAHGQPIETWADFAAELPAQYLPVAGREQFSARQRLAIAVTRFRIRYRTDLTRKMRIVFESQNWDITHFEEEAQHDRRQYMLIYAELVGAS